VLEIVKREPSATSIRSDAIQGAYAIRPTIYEGLRAIVRRGVQSGRLRTWRPIPVDVGPVVGRARGSGQRRTV